MSRRRIALLIGLVVIIAVPSFAAIHRIGRGHAVPSASTPRPQLVVRLRAEIALPGVAPMIDWPSAGESAVGVDGVGPFARSGLERPVPIASLAKVMTAAVILQDHPLRPGTSGPTLEMDASDVKRYRDGPQTRQSNLRVTRGERLTERQALDAILVPSANNIAYALARWDAGSPAAFVDRMNRMAARLDLHGTHYTDPSGYDAMTVSTAADQVDLALHAMQDPTFVEIVGQQSVVLPLVGVVRNYNRLLGGEIIGVKTGSTRPAGGCFIFAARRRIGASDRLVVGAVLGQRGADLLPAALASSQALERSILPALELLRLPVGTSVGVLRRGLEVSDLVTTEDIEFLAWRGAPLRISGDGGAVRASGVATALGSVAISLGHDTRRVGVKGGRPTSR